MRCCFIDTSVIEDGFSDRAFSIDVLVYSPWNFFGTFFKDTYYM